MNEGIKYDKDKQGWYPMPLVILKPLADVFLAGEKNMKLLIVLNHLKIATEDFGTP